MEVSGAETSQSSQPLPDPVCETPTSVPCADDLAAAGEGESASSIRERVVSGFKNLSKERDALVRLRNEVKLLRKQREALHIKKRSSMDAEVHLAKQRVEKQAAVVAMLEGRDGPFKEKFLNERRFGRMIKDEDDEISAADQLLPHSEATNNTPSQSSSGGSLQVVKVVETPLQVQHLVFAGDDIPESMPDRVKARKLVVGEKTVFVPFDNDNANNVLSMVEDHLLSCETETMQVIEQNDILAGEPQSPAEPIDLVCADSAAQAVAACPVPGEHGSILQQQDTSCTAPGEGESQVKDTVDMGNAKSADTVVSVKAVSGPASLAAGSELGMGKDAPTFAHVVSCAPGSITRPGQQVPRGSAQATTRQAVPAQASTSAAPGAFFAPFPSTGGQKRNVVLLKWEGGAVSPARRRVVDLILAMGFGANDLFTLIHVDGTRDYTISFTRPEGLDLFWERFEARCRSSPEWEGLVPIAVSVQSTVKKITIILSNESVPARDLEVWLRHYGELLTLPTKIMDDRDIWTGGWSVTMRLARDGNVVRHLPSSAFIGRDRMTIFYPGQPKLCHRCGEKGHFSSGCSAVICTLCRGRDHVAKECSQIRCNLCQRLGHPYSQCPDAWHNIQKEVKEDFIRLGKVEAFFNKSSSQVVDSPSPVLVPSPALAAIPSVSVSLPPVSVPVSPQPSVSVPSVSQESVSPLVSSPPMSVPSNLVEYPPSSQEEVRLVGVVEGTKGGVITFSKGQAPGKARAKTKVHEVVLSEDDTRYLEGRREVRRRRRQKTQVAQVVQAEEDPLPVSNRFSILSGTSASEASSENGEESDMECEGASRKREASGDEQQRGAKKPSI